VKHPTTANINASISTTNKIKTAFLRKHITIFRYSNNNQLAKNKIANKMVKSYKKLNGMLRPVLKGMSILTFVFILFGSGSNTIAQENQDPILLSIADEDITKSEFLAVYQKNNVEGEVLDKKSLVEYLELFINFKLKVKEAMDMGLDTVPSFINELKGYRDQLAKPYFIDEEVNAELLQQAYERKMTDVRVSHILIRVDKFATPADTLEAYNKTYALYERIMAGEDFNVVAEEASEDPSARDMPARGFQPARKGNRGDIGYFSVFDMVYPFEEASYSMDIGEVSTPVRTDFGYHLIMVQNMQPAMGKVQVAHLFLQMPKDATAEDSAMLVQKVDSLYQALEQGAEWDELVSNFSDDKSSAMNGGALPWFGSNRMVPEFIDGIATIADTGQISQPILTSYGWHIIKLMDTKPIKSYDEEKEELKQSLAKDTRSNKSKESIIRQVKADYNYKEYPKAVEAFNSVIDSSIYKRKWETAQAEGMNDLVFELGDEEFNQQDFAEYISTHQSISSKETIEVFLEKTFTAYVDDEVINFLDERLEEIYPEFKALVNEYRDGILLFELTDEKVWSAAIKDTTGLKAFHAEHKDDYMWGDRVDATLVTSFSEEAVKKARTMAKDGKTGEEIKEAFASDSLLNINVVDKKFERSSNDIIGKINWEKGVSKIVKDENGQSGFAIIHQLVGPEPKSLNEARGLITADYQNYLEKEWIEQLREKYPVTIHQAVLHEIK
jgi:peptidyl-prolyl cis-trans isomerase SurA